MGGVALRTLLCINVVGEGEGKGVCDEEVVKGGVNVSNHDLLLLGQPLYLLLLGYYTAFRGVGG